MGVPKFFCYTSERYPCLSELVREFQVPDFDNLYLDMNGIIHACSHPQDSDPTFSIQEETIFASIFHYIEVLFNMIKPKKLFFLAVDGVAPRAKMNQQRARRFRSAKDAEVLRKNFIFEHNVEPPKERFDSNCITPGTVFMDCLHNCLKYFITSKISSDPLWQQCKIILSGHQTPGEGEHKIMDYIRYMKTLPEYDPNTRHCLYGLDADLVMLGLCTHEPHFSLLREKIQFGNKNRKKMTSPDETQFYLLNLSLMREYIELEFQELKSTLPFGFNLENIIDDWVLMGFLVGNDFIPHLPGLHIKKGALPMLYKTYKEVLPTLDGYLNENGYLNLVRFQAYMEKLGEHDIKVFEETYANLAFLEGKMGGKAEAEEVKPKEDVSKKSDLEELIKATNELLLDEDVAEEEFLEDDSETFFLEFCQHKKDYYTNKLDYSNVTEEVLQSQAEGYIRAIQWNLHYYYQGCQSWSWYYPHHYAPYISDIKNFKDLKLDFEMGKPFLPFEQLLAVLPAASKNLLPAVYESLMTSPLSPIKDFYPEDFSTDLNGKTHEWEAVVLIPFIDEKRLLEAMTPYNDQLSEDERRRNSHGPMHVFTYTKEDLGVYKCEKHFPSIPSNHALMVDVDIKDIVVDKAMLKYGLRPGVLLDVFFPGFPTLKHIPHTGALKVAKLKVFNWLTSGDNMILTVTEREFPPLEQLAKDWLGQIAYVNWPHLVPSKVRAISDKEFKYTLSAEGEIEKTVLDNDGKSAFEAACSAVVEHYFKRLGIELGNTEVLVYASVMEGYKYDSSSSELLTLEKVWSSNPSAHPLQVIVKDLKVCEERTRGDMEYQEAFPVGSKVFMLGQPHFGSMGTVLDSSECLKNGRIKVSFDIATDPIISEDVFELESKAVYLPCRVAATKVGVTPRTLAQITGCIFIGTSDGSKMTNLNAMKVNIGLNLKHNFKNEELPGYTKKENDVWLYSMKAISLACSYVETFPHIVEYLSEHQSRNDFLLHDLFPGPEGPSELVKVIAWIKQQDFNNIMPIKVGSRVLESETVSKISELVDDFTPEVVTRVMQVKRRLLYKSDLVSGNLSPVEGAKHELFDRVVSIRSSYTVPIGLKGFIIGKHIACLESEVIYDVVFDKPFLGGSTIGSARERVFHMLTNSFVNLSDSRRSEQKSGVNLKTIPVSLEPQMKMMPPGPKPLMALSVPKPVMPPSPKQVAEDTSESSPSAFLRWIQEESQAKAAANPEKKNDDHFKELWQNLQSSKPSEETDILKKMLKIGDDKSKSPVIEEPVKSFFEKVSTSAKNGPPMNKQNGMKNGILSIIQSDNQPLNRYCVQLLSFYQRKYLGHPRYNYTYLGNKIIAHIQMRDGRVFSGLPCDEKVSASESAALHALVSLGQISLNGGEELIRKENENQGPSQGNMPVNAPMRIPMNAPVRAPTNVPMHTFMKENHRQGAPPARNEAEYSWREENRNLNQRQHGGNNNLPFPIPPPPSQWVGPNSNVIIKNRDQFYQSEVPWNAEATTHRRGNQNRPYEPSRPTTGSRVSAASLGFVPLQAITGTRNVGVIPSHHHNFRTKSSSQAPVSRPDVAMPNMPPFQGGSSSAYKPRRKPRIAANLALDQNLY